LITFIFYGAPFACRIYNIAFPLFLRDIVITLATRFKSDSISRMVIQTQPSPKPANAKLEAMLKGPIFITLLSLAWPNLVMMLAQSSTGFIEAWFLSKLGIDALAGAALVLPILMLMQSMSQGAMGGGISSAVARALGAGQPAQANSLALHALVLNTALGIICSTILIIFSTPLFELMGAKDASLVAALAYANIAFPSLVLMWIMNALASVIRGSGNMFTPGIVISGGAVLLIPISPLLIFGWGPFPAFGIAGAGWALVLYYASGTAVLLWYVLSGRNLARLEKGSLSWPPMRNILAVGGLATLNPLLTNGLIASTTAVVGAYLGTAALAGYGTAARLEYLIFPVAFGIGAPLVAMVASNLGANQPERALRIALTGGAMSFVVAEIIGLAAAIWPHSWMKLFGDDPHMIEAGVSYLRVVGPFFGFFGMGFTLYFAAQGARKLAWPLASGVLRLIIAVLGGWAILHITGSLSWFFAASALAMTLYGGVILVTTNPRIWFSQ
jgi:putative MATE family efflux protein